MGKAWSSEDQKLTLPHTECTECQLGPVGSSSLSAARPASHSLHHHGHLWATWSHLQGSGHTKAEKQGRVVNEETQQPGLGTPAVLCVLQGLSKCFVAFWFVCFTISDWWITVLVDVCKRLDWTGSNMCKFYLHKVQKQAKVTSGIEPMLALSYLWCGERGSAWEREKEWLVIYPCLLAQS